MNSSDIIQKVWSYSHILWDAGVSYPANSLPVRRQAGGDAADRPAGVLLERIRAGYTDRNALRRKKER
jgi:hypothetical protein